MADQCNRCGNFQNLSQCEHCTTFICANCKPTHAALCKDLQARKARGEGQTVRRINTLPEPKAEQPKPELHPVDDPKQDVVNAGVPSESDPFDVIASLAGVSGPNEGPWVPERKYEAGDVVDTERGLETIAAAQQQEAESLAPEFADEIEEPPAVA
jgi:hypothetical protein